MDYRDYVIELVEEYDIYIKDILISCLNYMSQDDVKDMLKCNEYLIEKEE